MPVTNCHPEPGSREWQMQRVGLVTASRCAAVCAMNQAGELAPRRNYREELMVEILTGQPFPKFVTYEMQWGLDHERSALIAYELYREVMIEKSGFVLHPDIARFGATPDALIGEDGLAQVKCPTYLTHLRTLLDKTIPVENVPQMLGELSCTKREWNDFVSFHPHFPPHLQLFVKRLYYDGNEKLVEGLEANVVHFNVELDGELARLPKSPQSNLVSILDYKNSDEVEL